MNSTGTTPRIEQRYAAVERAAKLAVYDGIVAVLKELGCFDDLHDETKQIGYKPGNPHNSICRGGWLCPIHVAEAEYEALAAEVRG